MLVDFYHLTASPLERVLPRICERVLEEGGRLLIVADADLLHLLDRQLWSYSRDSFLPHGRGRQGAEDQPVLLMEEPEALNGATNLAIADGRWRDEALGFARSFYFFDSGQIDEARGSWRALASREDVERRYWKQVDGKWVQGP